MKRLAAFGLCLLLLAAPAFGAGLADKNNNLIYGFRMGDTQNFGSHLVTLTLQGTVINTTGPFSGAYKIENPASPANLLVTNYTRQGDTDYTDCMWIKVEGAAAVLKGLGSGNPQDDGVTYRLNPSDCNVQLIVWDDFATSGKYFADNSFNGAFCTGDWEHLCLSYDDTGVDSSNFTIYHNGTKVYSILGTQDTNNADNQPWAIGAYTDYTATNHNANITTFADYVLFDTTLNSSDVSTLFNEGSECWVDSACWNGTGGGSPPGPPVVALDLPIDDYNATGLLESFIYNLTSVGAANCSLYLNDTLNDTATGLTTATHEFNVTFPGLGADYLWNVTCVNSSGTGYSDTRTYNSYLTPIATGNFTLSLGEPYDNFRDYDNNLSLYYALEVPNTANCSLIINGTINQTATDLTTGTHSFNVTFPDGRDVDYSVFVNCTNSTEYRNATPYTYITDTGDLEDDLLRAYWADYYNDTHLFDSSPSLYHAPFSGHGPDLLEPGICGYSMFFNESNGDYLEIGSWAPEEDEFTVCFFFKQSTNPDQYMHIVTKHDGGSPTNYVTSYTSWTDHDLMFSIGSQADPNRALCGYPDNPVEDGLWHSFCGVRRNTTSIELWYDGSLVNTTEFAYAADLSYDNFVIGARADLVPTTSATLWLDQVTIWNRSVNPDEIALWDSYNGAINDSCGESVNQTTLTVNFYDENTLDAIDFQNVVVELIGSLTSDSITTSNGTAQFGEVPVDTYTLRYASAGYMNGYYTVTLSDGVDTELDVYLQNSTITSNVTIYVYDTLGNRLEGATVTIMKYFIATNSYKTVEILTTNFEGRAVGNIILNDEYYKFLAEYDDYSSLTLPTIVYGTELTLYVVIGGQGFEDYFTSAAISGTLTHDYDTHLSSFTYSDSDAIATQGCVYAYQALGPSLVEYNNSCTNSTTGTVFIGLANTTGATYIVRGYVTKGGEDYLISGLTVEYANLAPEGGLGLFLLIILEVVIIMVGFWNLPVAIVLGGTAPLLLSITGMVSLGLTITVPIFALSLIVAYLVGGSGR